ncbi:hypothetical protein CRG98_037676 [Punica granatum]|uniref:Uncharacterized protein n=1 Tax=Punica granatum TaxID=22663 RepID=A0A2I0IEY5_PUNGR|nr:hypothetical protein CRG98_037676 [Punica granatum]
MGVCGRGQPLGGRRKRPQSTSALLMAREGRSSGTTNAGLRSQAQYRAPATQIRPIVVLEPRLFGLPSSPSHGSAIVDSQGSWGCISGHGSLKPWPLAFGSNHDSGIRLPQFVVTVLGSSSIPSHPGVPGSPSLFSITVALPSPSLVDESCGQRRACVVIVKVAVIGEHGGSQVLWEVAALGFVGLA